MYTSSMKDMNQKMPVLMVKSIKSILLKLTYLIEVNMEKVVTLNMNLLNNEVIFVLFITRIYCFVKSINFITGQDYKQQHLEFF